MLITTAIAIATFTLVVTAAGPTNNFITVPLSKGSNLHNEDGVLDIAAMNAHVAHIVAKIYRGFANYKNNTSTVHPNAKGLRERAPDSSGVALTDFKQRLWQGAIAIGSPPVNFIVGFDTGFGDFFLAGPDCGWSCVGRNTYFPGDSWSSFRLGRSFDIDFHDGSSVTGKVYSDTVQIAGLTAIGQSFGVATKYPGRWSGYQFGGDGILGMAFPPMSNTGMPLFHNLMYQKELKSSVFAFKLAPWPSFDSELFIGGTNLSHYTGKISYTPVIDPILWEVRMDSVEVDGISVLRGIKCAVSTGTDLIVGDTATVEVFYKAVGGNDASLTVGQGFYTFPCGNVHSVGFTFGGTSFPVSNFILGRIPAGSDNCVGAIVAVVGARFWSIGDSFLTGVYSVFDVGNLQVGFAALA